MPDSSNWDFPDARILVVDDTPVNLELVRELLEMEGYSRIQSVSDGETAIEAIVRDEPDLVLLDLHMPRMSGYDVLEALDGRLRPEALIPILVFTADTTLAAKQRALKLGASDFIAKPVESTELMLRVRNFLRMRRMHLALSDENVALEARVQARTRDLNRSRVEAIDCLARALEYRDDDTGGHVRRVGAMSADLAKALGLPDATVELIRLAAPLHDLGKIGISDTLLTKPGKYVPEEMREMQRHPLLGATIIGDCANPVLHLAKEISLYHHERWDGTGYPSGVAGEAIPISARIVAAADMFDALTHERPYKRAWTVAEALEEIAGKSGTHLDPLVVAALLNLVRPASRATESLMSDAVS